VSKRSNAIPYHQQSNPNRSVHPTALNCYFMADCRCAGKVR